MYLTNRRSEVEERKKERYVDCFPNRERRLSCIRRCNQARRRALFLVSKEREDASPNQTPPSIFFYRHPFHFVRQLRRDFKPSCASLSPFSPLPSPLSLVVCLIPQQEEPLSRCMERRIRGKAVAHPHTDISTASGCRFSLLQKKKKKRNLNPRLLWLWLSMGLQSHDAQRSTREVFFTPAGRDKN